MKHLCSTYHIMTLIEYHKSDYSTVFPVGTAQASVLLSGTALRLPDSVEIPVCICMLISFPLMPSSLPCDSPWGGHWQQILSRREHCHGALNIFVHVGFIPSNPSPLLPPHPLRSSWTPSPTRTACRRSSWWAPFCAWLSCTPEGGTTGSSCAILIGICGSRFKSTLSLSLNW